MDNKQFEKLVMSKEYLVKSCIKRLRIYKDHEDFYQVGMIGLLFALKNYIPERDIYKNFDVYAYYIILNYMRNEIKRSSRTPNLDELVNNYYMTPIYNTFEDELISRLEFEEVMTKLSEEERDIIELKKLGMKNSEISGALKLNDEQLKYKLKIIFKKIKKYMDKSI